MGFKRFWVVRSKALEHNLQVEGKHYPVKLSGTIASNYPKDLGIWAMPKYVN